MPPVGRAYRQWRTGLADAKVHDLQPRRRGLTLQTCIQPTPIEMGSGLAIRRRTADIHAATEREYEMLKRWSPIAVHAVG